MKKLLASFMLIICYGGLLLPQPGHTLRIKRSDSLVNTTANNLNANGTQQSPLSPPSIDPAMAVLAASPKPQDKAFATEAAIVAMGAIASDNAAATAAAAHGAVTAPVVTPIASSLAAATPAPAATASLELKLDALEDLQPSELSAHMIRGKRRMPFLDEALFPKMAHRARHHGGAIAGGIGSPPYVYFNKMVSPDGKQELKEFQLLAPNVVIESVQHDTSYGPGDMGGVLVLNADNNLNAHLHGLAKPKHHHKHKASLGLPPFLFLLQQMLQPSLSSELDMPTAAQMQTQTQSQMPHNRLESPLYQFLDSAVDNALRNNHEVFEHLVNDHDLELSEKEKDNGKERDVNELLALQKAEDNKSKDILELNSNHKDDELVVTCPIHHEHHTSNNGEIVDDDIVLVNECHIV